MKQEHRITQALANLVRQFVSMPDALRIEEKQTEYGLCITFFPHDADIAIMVGERGRQIKALQVLGAAMGTRAGVPVRILLEESMRANRKRSPRIPDAEPNPMFTLDTLYDALKPVVGLALGPDVPIDTGIVDRKYYAWVDVPSDDTLTVMAINDLMYPVGRHNGHIVEVKTELSRKPQPEVV